MGRPAGIPQGRRVRHRGGSRKPCSPRGAAGRRLRRARARHTRGDGTTAMARLLSLPDAVFCSNDLPAVCALRMAAECGRRVLEDVAVVGAHRSGPGAVVSPAARSARRSTTAPVAPRRRLGGSARAARKRRRPSRRRRRRAPSWTTRRRGPGPPRRRWRAPPGRRGRGRCVSLVAPVTRLSDIADQASRHTARPPDR
ncbi:substrate-binding domain-containing protein [Saccharothrix sp. 6-C]|nr:substrate-binding domain-containing protein [Saccharothrix sp. 6-C]